MHGSGICTSISIVYISGASEASMALAMNVLHVGVAKLKSISENLVESWDVSFVLL
jgi:hypothetical protein